MGLDENFHTAFAKSQIAAGNNLPSKGTAFLSVKDSDKKELVEIAKKLVELGFRLVGTQGTTEYLKKNNISINKINKISEGSIHIVDLIKNNEISLVINTVEGKKSSMGDSYIMRRNALISNTPYYTTIKGAKVAVNSIEIIKDSSLKVRSLQSIY